MLFPLLSTLKLAVLLHRVEASESQNDHAKNGRSNCKMDANGRDGVQWDCCGSLSPPQDAVPKCRLRIDFRLWQQCAQLEHCEPSLSRVLAHNRHAQFTVAVEQWSGDASSTADLFNPLHRCTVLSLELRVDLSPRIEVPNLGLFFPRLANLAIVGQRESKTVLIGGTFLRDLPALRALKATNVNFSLGEEAPQWLSSLERLDLANCSLLDGGELPRWLSQCVRLERVWLRSCSLTQIAQLAQLPNVVQIRAEGNHFADVHKLAFPGTRLQELELRGNRISRIGVHTLSLCRSLRLLDLSDNPLGKGLPDRAFQGCRRLRELRLRRIEMTRLRPELLLGLNALKSLSVAGNPLSHIDPFTFLPTRSIRSLDMDNCSLRSVPLAVTQCCLLDSLSIDDNRMSTRESMSPAILALLPRLSHFSFSRNPLLQLPWGLFLYEQPEPFLGTVIDTLIQSPVWRLEPCTPFLWHLHLRNSSFPALRQRTSAWNGQRAQREGMAHCAQLYDTILGEIGIYRELRENSGCEATRRLRSVRAGARETKQECAISSGDKPESLSGTRNISNSSSSATIVRMLLAPAAAALANGNEKLLVDRRGGGQNVETTTLLHSVGNSSKTGILPLSLGANLCLLTAGIALFSWKMAGKKRTPPREKDVPRREDFEEI